MPRRSRRDTRPRYKARVRSSPPPVSREQLLERAHALVGRRLDDLAASLEVSFDRDATRTKGTWGTLIERALGASGSSAKVKDFPELDVELKTIPTDERGVPVESTYVCTLSLGDADAQEWATSWVRAKLSLVLFVPLVGRPDASWPERTVAAPRLWSPSAEQEEILRADFDDVVGLVGVGRIEELTAHRGRWLQVRPKAAHGRVRTVAYGADGEVIETVPRGFYLRARFTGAVLADPTAVPA